MLSFKPLSHCTRFEKNADMTAHNPDGGASGASRTPPRHREKLRLLCLAEATTLLVLLLVAVPLKYLAGDPQAVAVMGPIHGFAFLAFGWMLVQALAAGDIARHEAAKLLLAAFLPLGGLYSWWALR